MWLRLFLLSLGVLTIAFLWGDGFDPEKTVRGRRVVITGASTGIGEQLAYEYARLGARIVITARTEVRLKQVIAKCREVGDANGDYFYYVADMSDLNGTKAFIDYAEKQLGVIDYLVLNHILVAPFQEWVGSEDNFYYLDKIIDVNFKAYVHLASYALPALKASSGSLVVVSSVAGKLANPYVAVYSASKHALYGFFGAVRQELMLSSTDVSITTCVIGLINTDNAIKNIEGFGLNTMLNALKPASPVDTARAIIRGGATRQREIFFPYMEAKFATLFRDWFPEALEWYLRHLHQRE